MRVRDLSETVGLCCFHGKHNELLTQNLNLQGTLTALPHPTWYRRHEKFREGSFGGAQKPRIDVGKRPPGMVHKQRLH